MESGEKLRNPPPGLAALFSLLWLHSLQERKSVSWEVQIFKFLFQIKEDPGRNSSHSFPVLFAVCLFS
jgi:hypothetical protein